MSNIILVSTAYLPPISYVAILLKVDHIIIEQHEHYIKQTYRNRTEIYGANGKLPLIIPVDHQELASTPIKEVKISYTQPWMKIHWRSIESAYRNSPYFEYYEDALKPFYEKEYKYLFEWNMELLTVVLNILRVKKKIVFTEAYEKEPMNSSDLRNEFIPGKKLLNANAHYHQVFSDRNGFIANLSIIDLLFNEGPQSLDYLNRLPA